VAGLSPWISSLLTALGILGTMLGVWLTRRGKQEDNRRAEYQQTFDQLQEVATARKDEIDRLTIALASSRAETDTIRTKWEDRWDRQMKRCRVITASLVHALAELKRAAGPADGDGAVQEAMDALHQHNEDDHNEE
jgi:uncharacterized protein YlxW (UPF0749 family)